jgi:hypothetical protein
MGGLFPLAIVARRGRCGRESPDEDHHSSPALLGDRRIEGRVKND